MTIKPFAIQGADLTLGGVSLQAGATAIVIPGVTQATNYTVDEVNDRDGNNPDTFGNDTEAVTVIDNAEYLYLLDNGSTPSNSYVAATYSVDELDDGQIEEINVDSVGVFLSADVANIDRGNMWATTVADPFASFNANDWTEVPFRPKMRAGEVETIGGSGGGVDGLEGNTNFEPDSETDTRYELYINDDISLRTYQKGDGANDLGPGVSLGFQTGGKVGSGVVAIGNIDTGYDSKKGGVYIGYQAGWNDEEDPQGEFAIAIGARAARNFAQDNSITLNATGTNLDPTAEGLYIKPIRESSNSKALYYNTTTGEITYDDGGSGGGSNSYTPDDADNWNEPTINTIAAALDELAARVTALQNYEIDGGNANTPAAGELLIDGNGA